MAENNKSNIPIWEKQNLTVKEAAAYSGIGENTIRSLLKSRHCPFLLRVGAKQMIKRKQFDEYIEKNQCCINRKRLSEGTFVWYNECTKEDAYKNYTTRRLLYGKINSVFYKNVPI